MPKMITGRRLDGNGHPIDGTGFEYDSDGRLAELLHQRISPLYSQPVTGEWVFGLVLGKDTKGEFERGAGVFPTGNAGPAEHYHPNYDEHFDIVQGEFIFTVSGQDQRIGAGEQVLVKKGTPHRFRCIGEGYGAVVVETRPAATIGVVITTLFGLAHEDALTAQGQPKLLQAMVMGSEYADDTVFTNPPPSIAIPMAKAMAPLGRLLGYRPSYAKYQEDSYWIARVEQPKARERDN